MPTMPAQQKRLEPARSSTWPPTNTDSPRPRGQPGHAHIHKSKSAPPVMPPSHPKPPYLPFEDDLNKNPENHFLSPVQMYEFEDWADDSDDDGDEVEWDAGITDFALFDHDRRRAAERHEEMPDRWDGLLASQASALQRAVERNRSDSFTQRRAWTPLLEDLPQLTPDSSPDLRGDFDIHAHLPTKPSRQSVPNYLSVKVTPSEEDEYDGYDDEEFDDSDDSDDDELPVAYLVERARERRRQARKTERPGMRFDRTMSGKVHVWRRPSYHIYAVHEDAEAERRAELLPIEDCGQSGEERRGRRR